MPVKYPDISNMLYTMTTDSNDAGYSNSEYDAIYQMWLELLG